MTNEKQEEAGPVIVQIAVCSVCHALFMLSGDRETSPCCGADPLAVLATLTLGSDAHVTGEWGMGADVLPTAAEEEPAPAPAPPEEPPAEEEVVEAPEEEVDNVEVFLEGVKGYLSGAGVTGDDLHTWLARMGAEPEAAATAVGRLEAVRELLESLEPPREAASVAPAPPEAESSPENT